MSGQRTSRSTKAAAGKRSVTKPGARKLRGKAPTKQEPVAQVQPGYRWKFNTIGHEQEPITENNSGLPRGKGDGLSAKQFGSATVASSKVGLAAATDASLPAAHGRGSFHIATANWSRVLLGRGKNYREDPINRHRAGCWKH